jgi:hypothetical protein
MVDVVVEALVDLTEASDEGSRSRDVVNASSAGNLSSAPPHGHVKGRKRERRGNPRILDQRPASSRGRQTIDLTSDGEVMSSDEVICCDDDDELDAFVQVQASSSSSSRGTGILQSRIVEHKDVDEDAQVPNAHLRAADQMPADVKAEEQEDSHVPDEHYMLELVDEEPDSGASSSSCSTVRRRGSQELNSCEGCGSSQESCMLIRADCEHVLCGPCIRKAVGLDDDESQACSSSHKASDVKGCPQCRQTFSDHDMLQCMTREEVDVVQEKLFLRYLDSNPDVVRCPGPGCQARIERSTEPPGKVDRVAPDGQQLTKSMALHMSQNRLRCPDCGTNFCASCFASPYHVALTCSQHQERQVKRHLLVSYPYS